MSSVETRDSNDRKTVTGSNSDAILPGRTIGLLGGGQLGRMFALEARRLGYRVHVFDPEPGCPAGQVSDREVSALYSDIAALEDFASSVDVVTYEFENIPVSAIDAVAAITPVAPRGEVLHICQNREREKTFLRNAGIPCADFRVVDSAESLTAALKELGGQGVLKTADFGYDGKGQVRIRVGDDPAQVWASLDAPRGVLEAWVPFAMELSVVAARGRDHSVAVFPVVENIHTNHILDLSVIPARVPEASAQEAIQIAGRVIKALDVVGLLAVEFFLLSDGRVIVNELAPRPHNSGHFSFDACVTSQFEQQLRAVCGLPLGSVELLRPIAMKNLLGDIWNQGEPDWAASLADPDIKLHLYGKRTPRPGRKMGHLCAFGTSNENALAKVEAAAIRLGHS
jgi:5-(carboxyamino)imidazole ribonucleotide synthase